MVRRIIHIDEEKCNVQLTAMTSATGSAIYTALVLFSIKCGNM